MIDKVTKSGWKMANQANLTPLFVRTGSYPTPNFPYWEKNAFYDIFLWPVIDNK